MGVPASASSPRGQQQDLYHWSHWWHLERDLYLWSPERLRGFVDVRSGTDDGLRPPIDGLPSRAVIEDHVIPGLLSILETERHDDMQTATLVALARVGSVVSERRASAIRSAILLRASASSQEVAETSVFALGVLGGSASLPPLIEILSGSPEGCKLVGKSRVPTRTKGFAAYGIGLLAERHPDVAIRQRAALALIDALDQRAGSSDDLDVAAITALGLTGIPNAPTLPPRDLLEHADCETVTSSASLALWLEQRCSDKKTKKARLPNLARAHGYVALARVGAGSRPRTRSRVIGALIEAATARSNDVRIRTSVLIALGQIVRASKAPADVEGLTLLTSLVKSGQPLERRFASMALAHASTRPAGDGAPLEGLKEAQRALMRRLASGNSQDSAWAALALGVQAHAADEAGEEGAMDAGQAILKLLRKDKSASTIGAYAIGSALAFIGSEPGAATKPQGLILDALERTNDPSTRGHIAIALGMLAGMEGRHILKEIVDESKFRPEALWSASVALSMLGDRSMTPMLIKTLTESRSGVSRAAAAAALGRIGDERAVVPLLKLSGDKSHPSNARAFGIVSLGILCDDQRVPWRVPIAHALPYFATTSTLWGSGRGVLDIL